MSETRASYLVGRPARRSAFVPVREPGTNWLLFKYDPVRELVEIQRRGKKTIIDLRSIRLETLDIIKTSVL
jgi:hypothetical protein